MAIFRKLVERKSKAVIAIEALSEEEAEIAYEAWIKDNDHNAELDDFLLENSETTEEWLYAFDNRDAYNRAKFCDDFQIDQKGIK